MQISCPILHGDYRPRSHLPTGRGEHALHGLGLLRMRGKQTDGSTGRLSREAVADGVSFRPFVGVLKMTNLAFQWSSLLMLVG